MDVYETGLIVQRAPLWAAESEKTMDNTTQDKQAFYRELQGRRVFEQAIDLCASMQCHCSDVDRADGSSFTRI